MPRLQRLLPTVAVAITAVLLLLVPQSQILANDGEPLAVRSWPGGLISIETHWGLLVAITSDKDEAQKTIKEWSHQPNQIIELSSAIDHSLIRKPNTDSPTWQPSPKVKQPDDNAVDVKSVLIGTKGASSIVISADGVRILVLSLGAVKANAASLDEMLKDMDLLILTGESASFSNATEPKAITALVSALSPKLVLLNPTDDIETVVVEKFVSSIDENTEIRTVGHNTLAISKSTPRLSSSQWITLTDQPWQMPDEMAALFDAMEKSCGQSQAIFKKLSTQQMNFKPGNGTHTPRWNAEHMMGRQLGFFSQIYQTIDPSIPAMDLNPKQMPPDYVFAHPDWDGVEEARQMRRVSDFCRRFAYLLDGVAINQRAPGSRWPTLGALLKQMDRHYSEHTDNTIKKFELPDWPKE